MGVWLLQLPEYLPLCAGLYIDAAANKRRKQKFRWKKFQNRTELLNLFYSVLHARC
jgi:hypothetical protein